MSEETKTETTAAAATSEEKAAWKQFLSKYKAVIGAAIVGILGIVAGDQGIVEGITSIVKGIFGG